MREREQIRSLYGPWFLPGCWVVEVMVSERRVSSMKADLGVLRR